ncbi:hypothetical protein K7640_12800 [Micromonospora sp. PLK6-60]|uniref:hypothetical protein n=1 Tax=Micromonospora sp. PLK6-60 TaxID=2873383 RepID=UPI001CA73377|nr:hypothetical protein [Micromonospora sp. PLK6-60]MBY8872714.1 hypothetical protein [Micromonospora sp. PLK6-60]
MALPFVVTLRGYDMGQVEELFAQVDAALAADSEVLRAAARDALRAADLRRRVRGYAPHEVDDAVAQRLAALAFPAGWNGPVPPRAAPVAPVGFVVTAGGYDIRQVDRLFAQADAALAADSHAVRVAARDALRTTVLRRRLRGYERRAVADAVAERLQAL